MSLSRPSPRTLAQAVGAAGAALLLIAVLPSTAAALPIPGMGIPGLDRLNPFSDNLQEWGVKKAGELVLSIIAGLVDLLLPDSIGRQGAALIQWIGSGPDFARAVKEVPALNRLMGYSLWIGFSILPATIAYAGIRMILGDGPSVTELASRLLGALIVLALWPYIWQTLSLLTSNITAVYLKNTVVVAGLNKYVELLVMGTAVTAALGALTWPLLTLVVMGVGGFFFVSLLVFKAGLWIIGAAVYVGGPILIGFITTDRGMAMIRSLGAIVTTVFGLPIVWSMILAVTAITINGGAAMTKVLGGPSGAGQVFGALMMAAVAIIGPGMCFWLGKAVLGGVAGSVMSSAKSVTARSSGGGAPAPGAAAAPKSAGAGAATVAKARENVGRGWNRGLGGSGPQPAGTSRMAMHGAKSGGLAGAGGTVAGAIWRSQGSSLKKTMAGAQAAKSTAGKKVGGAASSAATGVYNGTVAKMPGVSPVTAGAPMHSMGAVPPQPKEPRQRATRGGRENDAVTVNQQPALTGNGNGSADNNTERAAQGAAVGTRSRPSTSTSSASTAYAKNGAGRADATNSASTPSNGGTAGAATPAKGSSRPRTDRGTAAATPRSDSAAAPTPRPAADPARPAARSSRGEVARPPKGRRGPRNPITPDATTEQEDPS